ncbi:TcpD family membrane protein [Enterococcus cecorum]|uniref:TcpD family membrane protein n=1 Tax=Enterococcus cecorum TaxID=44008 RepID=UPI001FAB952C|nr:TcpD family membrane protein [Enterococcus cecorum]MCJ0564702.1 TcpD family membrane protein [Enterococcus cecorum]
MSLSGLFEWLVSQAKYGIATAVAYWIFKGFGKSKVVSIIVGVLVGGFGWYFLEHYDTVLSKAGEVVGKLFS